MISSHLLSDTKCLYYNTYIPYPVLSHHVLAKCFILCIRHRISQRMWVTEAHQKSIVFERIQQQIESISGFYVPSLMQTLTTNTDSQFQSKSLLALQMNSVGLKCWCRRHASVCLYCALTLVMGSLDLFLFLQQRTRWKCLGSLYITDVMRINQKKQQLQAALSQVLSLGL